MLHQHRVDAGGAALALDFEALHPQPPLMGRDAKDQGVVEMWNRRMELEVLLPTIDKVVARLRELAHDLADVPNIILTIDPCISCTER